MGNHTKENRKKKKQREKSQFWAVKVSFVTGIIVIITIFKDLVEYFEFELPLGGNIIYAIGCLVPTLVILGTKKLDKHLNSKGAENFGAFLAVASIWLLVLENTFFKIKGNAIDTVLICVGCVVVVIGAVYLLFSKYEK